MAGKHSEYPIFKQRSDVGHFSVNKILYIGVALIASATALNGNHNLRISPVRRRMSHFLFVYQFLHNSKRRRIAFTRAIKASRHDWHFIGKEKSN